jgi:hypothetical protein
MPSYIGNKKGQETLFRVTFFMSKVMQMGNQFGYYRYGEGAPRTRLQQRPISSKRIGNKVSTLQLLEN